MGPRTSKPFTVWNEGCLVGETHLDYVANTSEVKFGDFTATEYGERVIAIRMAPRKALCAHAPWREIQALYACREAAALELRARDGRVVPTDDIEITDLEWLASLVPAEGFEESWEDDLRFAELESLEELQPASPFRDDITDLFPTDWIELQDDLPADDCDLFSETDPEAPPLEFPRYQIQVSIKGGG